MGGRGRGAAKKAPRRAKAAPKASAAASIAALLNAPSSEVVNEASSPPPKNHALLDADEGYTSAQQAAKRRRLARRDSDAKVERAIQDRLSDVPSEILETAKSPCGLTVREYLKKTHALCGAATSACRRDFGPSFTPTLSSSSPRRTGSPSPRAPKTSTTNFSAPWPKGRPRTQQRGRWSLWRRTCGTRRV